MGPGRWLADGRVPVDDLSEELGVQLPEGPYTTVAGLILDLAGRIPSEGDAVDSDGFRLVVTRMDRNRVDRVHVERLPDE
jgi:putative hemolysin